MPNQNDQFAVLATTGNSAMLAKNQTLAALATGGLGLFSKTTGLSLDATSTAAEIGNEIFFATKLADGSIRESAGQKINPRLINYVNSRCYVAPVETVFEITDFKAACNTDYCLKVPFTSMTQYQISGTSFAAKSFVVHTSCCTDDCAACPDGSCSELATLLYNAINTDPEGLLVAEYIDAAGGDVIEPEDLADWVIANPTLCPFLRVTTVSAAVTKFCNINPKYTSIRNFNIQPSLGCGFECNGTVTVTVQPVVEQGAGYDLKQLESEALGWTGEPGIYRTSSVVPFPYKTFNYSVSDTTNYRQFVINYEVKGTSNFVDFFNTASTIIAVPATSTTTDASVVAVINRVISQLALAIPALPTAAC